MQKNAAYFAEKLLKRGTITSQNRILDYGCGPGSLAEQLKGKVRSYQGVDISADCIQSCRERFAASANIRFDTIDTTVNAGLEQFTGNAEPFDVIIILSVIQYFPDLTKVEELLAACKKMLSPNGKIILADVIRSNQGLLKDAFSNLVDSIRKNYFLSFIRFMYQARFSKYNQLRLKNDLLCVSEGEIAAICQQLNLKYSIMPTCTLQHSRVSYCITA